MAIDHALIKLKGRNILQLEIKHIKPYTKSVKIRKSRRSYECFLTNENLVTLRNRNNEEISFAISESTPDSQFQNDPYICSLKKDAKIALGLIP